MVIKFSFFFFCVVKVPWKCLIILLKCCTSPMFNLCTNISVFVTQVEYTYPAQSDISAGAKDLIARLLKHNPMHRLPIQGVLSHPWVVETATKKPTTLSHEEPGLWVSLCPSTQNLRFVCGSRAEHRLNKGVKHKHQCAADLSESALLTLISLHLDVFVCSHFLFFSSFIFLSLSRMQFYACKYFTFICVIMKMLSFSKMPLLEIKR